MKLILYAALAAILPLTLWATEAPTALSRWQAEPGTVFEASETTLDEFLWLARPVVVFADSPADPRFAEQMTLIEDRISELTDRDVVVITDTDPAAKSAIRMKLRPRGFMIALVAKDGRVNLRKPTPWDVRELSRAIDKMPLRQQEIRDANTGLN